LNYGLRGVRNAVWFGFEAKSHPNCKKKYEMRFGLVWLVDF